MFGGILTSRVGRLDKPVSLLVVKTPKRLWSGKLEMPSKMTPSTKMVKATIIHILRGAWLRARCRSNSAIVNCPIGRRQSKKSDR